MARLFYDIKKDTKMVQSICGTNRIKQQMLASNRQTAKVKENIKNSSKFLHQKRINQNGIKWKRQS